MACRHHATDESCADCDGSSPSYEKPGVPVSKERGLELAKDARRQLNGQPNGGEEQ